jgi:predicted amidophosphoribosyltransferase
VAAKGVVLEAIHRYKYKRALWFEPFLARLLIRTEVKCHSLASKVLSLALARVAQDWLERYRRFWEESFQLLDGLLDELKANEKKLDASDERGEDS